MPAALPKVEGRAIRVTGQIRWSCHSNQNDRQSFKVLVLTASLVQSPDSKRKRLYRVNLIEENRDAFASELAERDVSQ